MAVMKTLLLAKTTAFISNLQPGIIAIMVVAFEQKQSAVHRTNHCVGTAVIWTIPSAGENVIMFPQLQRIHIDGLVSVAPRSVFSTHPDAMGYLIVMMAAMKVIVCSSLRLVLVKHFCYA